MPPAQDANLVRGLSFWECAIGVCYKLVTYGSFPPAINCGFRLLFTPCRALYTRQPHQHICRWGCHSYNILYHFRSGVRRTRRSEVSLALFLFHGGVLVEVDDAGGTFRLRGGHHLLHNLFDGVRLALDGSRERPASEGAERDFLRLDAVALFCRQAVVIGHDELAVEVDDGTLLGEI